MEIETEGVQERVEFLECMVERKKEKWEYERKEKRIRKLKRFMEYESYGDRRKIEMVIGALSRVEQNCSEKKGILVKGMGVIQELQRAGYLNTKIKRGLDRIRKRRETGRVWREVRKIVSF